MGDHDEETPRVLATFHIATETKAKTVTPGTSTSTKAKSVSKVENKSPIRETTVSGANKKTVS